MEILNTVTGSPAGTSTLIALLIVFVVLAAAAASYLVYWIVDSLCDRKYGVTVICFFTCAIYVVITFFCWRGLNVLRAARETIVYATIDDSTPWSEINERYELIRQDGKIYQLRLREEVSHE